MTAGTMTIKKSLAIVPVGFSRHRNGRESQPGQIDRRRNIPGKPRHIGLDRLYLRTALQQRVAVQASFKAFIDSFLQGNLLARTGSISGIGIENPHLCAGSNFSTGIQLAIATRQAIAHERPRVRSGVHNQVEA
jgi:hypothetical protein